jgi:hypothetical protein
VATVVTLIFLGTVGREKREGLDIYFRSVRCSGNYILNQL